MNHSFNSPQSSVPGNQKTANSGAVFSVEREKKILQHAYAQLSSEKRKQFARTQQQAIQTLADITKNTLPFPASLPLSADEQQFISLLQQSYARAKAQNPQLKNIAFDFQSADKKQLYEILVQKLAFFELENTEKEASTKHLATIRAQHQITPSLPEESYGKFFVKNGSTDEDIFWHQYENEAIDLLKANNMFSWGKERLYFDVPLAQMEALRDLCMTVAKKEKIAVAFKYLDTAKTAPINLREEQNTTRFVANFSSIQEAKRFYGALRVHPTYSAIVPDRATDYRGLPLDNLTHYASGLRERREAVERIVKTARPGENNQMQYTAINGKTITISAQQYATFFQEYQDYKNIPTLWENA